jgi:hypothetical protein
LSIGGRKITRESAYGEKLLLFPKNAGEAKALQKALLAEGFIWVDGNKSVEHIEECVNRGLVLMDGKIYHRSEGDTTTYTVCPLSQAERDVAPAAPDRVSPNQIPQDQVLQLFNKLSARIDGLSEKIDRMYGELYPTVEETKPGLKKPQP